MDYSWFNRKIQRDDTGRPINDIHPLVFWIFWLVFAAWLVFMMSGCATPRTESRTMNGIAYVAHIDQTTTPCLYRGADSGCASPATGEIWISGAAGPHVERHEVAHIAGMRHGEWEMMLVGTTQRLCSRVTVAAWHYKVGDLICVDRNGERVFSLP